jgi:hypothetical protein
MEKIVLDLDIIAKNKEKKISMGSQTTYNPPVKFTKELIEMAEKEGIL